MPNPQLKRADPLNIYKNHFSQEEFEYMITERPNFLEGTLHGRLMELAHEAKDTKFLAKWQRIMEADQGNRNICFTCAFLSMLCMQLSELGINVTATSMLQQMDTAGASWLKGVGTQPTIAELEDFMKKQWFVSDDGQMFRVSVAMSVCFNSQCTIPADKRNKHKQASYTRLLLKHIREGHSGAKFVIGLVNLLPVFVNGKNMSTHKIIHNEARDELHALALFRANPTDVKCWNSWSGVNNVVTLKLEDILTAIVTNVTELQVQDSAQRVTDLIHAQPVESGWSVRSTPYSKIEIYMLTSWLQGKNVYNLQGKCTTRNEYALQPRPQTAVKQPIKRPPAQAHDLHSTQNPPKKKRRTKGGVHS